MTDEFHQRLEAIEKRNARVESNKAWETSWLRRGTIALLTYITVVIYHLSIGAHNVLIISLVPVIGFVVSTLSLQIIRSRFDKYRGEH
jgi:hypothetical protein